MSLNLPARLNIFKKKDHIPKSPKYEGITMPIEYAFTVGGKRYFRFGDSFNIPPIRGLKSVTYFEEARMKCSMEYIELHTKRMDELLGVEGKIDRYEIKKLNDQLKERLQWKLPDLNLLYKLASVIFFEEGENPADYDFNFNNRKIEHWKKEASATDFFTLVPLRSLLPFLNVPEESFQTCSQIVEEMNALHLETLLSPTSQGSTQSS